MKLATVIGEYPELANLLAELIHELDEDTVDWIIAEIRGRRASRTRGGPTH